MTLQLYLKDTYLFNSEGLILQKSDDEKGTFVLLDKTVFYPQGGGQPSDQGLIKNDDVEAGVTLVRQIHNEIRHYINRPLNAIAVYSRVDCLVNKERRMLNSRYHTAGHLLSNIIEMKYPQLKAIKGHSFPGEAYVEFQGNITIDSIETQAAIDEAIARNDKTTVFEIDPVFFEQQFYTLPYRIPENKKFRAMQIGTMLPVPCGGTHLSSTGEIGRICIGKVKAKNNMMRISYEVT